MAAQPITKSTATPEQHAKMQANRSALADLRAQAQANLAAGKRRATPEMRAERDQLRTERAELAAEIGRPLGKGSGRGGTGPPPQSRIPPSDGTHYAPVHGGEPQNDRFRKGAPPPSYR